MSNVQLDPNDPWALANSHKYSPDRIYNRATDGKGHKENVLCPVPPSILHEIQALVASKVFPEYRTTQDFIRDAIVHRAKYVSERIKSGVLAKAVDDEIMLSVLARERADRKAKQTIINGFQEEFRDCVLARDRARLADLVQNAFDFADQLPDPYGKELRQMAEMNDKYVKEWKD